MEELEASLCSQLMPSKINSYLASPFRNFKSIDIFEMLKSLFSKYNSWALCEQTEHLWCSVTQLRGRIFMQQALYPLLSLVLLSTTRCQLGLCWRLESLPFQNVFS